MLKTTALCIVGSLAASAAIADGSFGGFYGALDLGRVHGSATETPPGTLIPVSTGNVFGAVAGWNVQNGQLVYGAEIGFQRFNGFVRNGGLAQIDGSIDVKARVGYAFGNALLYGAVGWSWADYVQLGAPSTFDGVNYGLGMEYNVTDRFFVGLDYTARRVVGTVSSVEDVYRANTASVRAGLRF